MSALVRSSSVEEEVAAMQEVRGSNTSKDAKL